MCIDSKELNTYSSLNRFAHKNSVVMLGSTYFKEMPLGELKQVFGIMSDIYNRSLTDLSVFEAEEIAISTIESLIPKKLVLQLGETDLEDQNHSVDEVISAIESLISKAHKTDRTLKIVLVSINNLSNKALQNEFNLKLEKLAKKSKCTYADITSAEEDPTHIHSFRLLKFFMADDYLLQIM